MQHISYQGAFLEGVVPPSPSPIFMAVMLPVLLEGAGGIPIPKPHASGLGVYGGEEAEENAGRIRSAIQVEYLPSGCALAGAVCVLH